MDFSQKVFMLLSTDFSEQISSYYVCKTLFCNRFSLVLSVSKALVTDIISGQKQD